MKTKEEKLEQRRKYRDKNKERINELKRLSYQRNKEGQKKYYKKYLYNITQEDYNFLLEKQKGVCAICGEEETVIQKSTGTVRDLSVDHCHNSKLVRGLLCCKCNVALGMFKDSIGLLNNAIKYLESYK